jgi:cytidylate kinase
VVFPQAECKFYLTASAAERAQRRYRELQSRGEAVNYEEVLAGQQQRDRRDAARHTGPLLKADDAVEVCTDELELDEVVDLLERLVRERWNRANCAR